jgi:hypothetical protein
MRISLSRQVTSCTFYELPEDFRMNKKVTLAAARLGSCVAVPFSLTLHACGVLPLFCAALALNRIFV